MFGAAFFGKHYFGAAYWGPGVIAPPSGPSGPTVLTYGLLRRRREEYQRLEDERIAAEQQFAHEIAERIDEGLPPEIRPEPEPLGTDELDAAPFPLATDESIAARITIAVEARLRAIDDYDDEEEAVLALLLAH